MVVLGTRLRNRRRQLSLTQEQLAERTGVSRTAVAKWESGEKEPTLQNLRRLCAVLNTSSDYLLGLDEKFQTAYLSDKATEALTVFIEEAVK